MIWRQQIGRYEPLAYGRGVAGKRVLVPVSGQLKPAGPWGPPPWVYPIQAWLEGSMLTVETGSGVRQCDLATAWKVRLRPVPTFMRGWCLVLSICQRPRARPVRLALQGPDGILVSADGIRLLAQIISSQSARPRKTARVTRRLRELAALQDMRTKPIDWSFRTDPQGHNQPPQH